MRSILSPGSPPHYRQHLACVPLIPGGLKVRPTAKVVDWYFGHVE